ncbi:MAG TPA: peroxiredoxin [Steroidobacteraceae bacterium]|jgi:thioredoxin-dependent peroxiredoxin|nr:peroxiredoxin [Steroidobacteraceae bacterium]
MLTPGERAPEFTLPDQDNRERSLTSLLGDGPLILYFYPADFTPGCTAEACTLRDLHTEIQHAGLRVVGVSPQQPESHRRFRDKYTLPFTLLSDPDKTVIRMYDVNGPLGIGVRRATYLVDQARMIQDAVLADFRIGRHEEFVRNAVALRQIAQA